MRQFKKKQKLVATLMAAVALSGSKVTPPAAAMSQGLNKATTKASTNKKNGLPAWAKWLIIGGGSAVGAAAIAGTIWWCLKGKNKDQKIPDEKNEEIPVKLKGSKKAVTLMDSEKKNKKNKSKLYPIKEEDESEEEDNNKESKDESVDINKKDENAFEEQPKEEDFTIIYNAIEDKENEEKQKEEEKAKRKAEKQENENAFYEAVKKFEPLSEAMEKRIKYSQRYTKKSIYNQGNAACAYSDFKNAIRNDGKSVKVKIIDKYDKNNMQDASNVKFKESVIKNINDVGEVLHYEIKFNTYGTFDIMLFGNNKVAFKELTNAIVYEYKKNPKYVREKP